MMEVWDRMDGLEVIASDHLHYVDGFCGCNKESGSPRCEVMLRLFLIKDKFENDYVRCEIERQSHDFGSLQALMRDKDAAVQLYATIKEAFKELRKDVKHEVINKFKDRSNIIAAIQDSRALAGFFFKKYKEGDSIKTGAP